MGCVPADGPHLSTVTGSFASSGRNKHQIDAGTEFQRLFLKNLQVKGVAYRQFELKDWKKPLNRS